jgi:hypothetical protein
MDSMARPGFTIYGVLLTIALSSAVLLCLPRAAGAASPSGPTHEFYGTVSSGGQPAGAGYVVTAVVNGEQVASSTTNSQGKWGGSQSFMVAVPSGSLIEFYVNGRLVGSAASCIATNQLTLPAAGIPQPSNAQPADRPLATTPSNTTSPMVSGGGAAPSTQTFYVGPQPSGAGSQPVALISCTLPGKEDSFTLRNGVLLTATKLNSAGGDIELDMANDTSISLNGARQISVARLLSPPPAPPGSGLVTAYSFGPENSTFSPPVTLKLKYEADSLPAGMEESGLYLAQLADSGEWTALTSSLDTTGKSVSLQLSHFSVYALLGKLTAKPANPVSSSASPNNIAGPGSGEVATVSKPQAEDQQAIPVTKAGQQASGMDIFVFVVLIAGGIMVVVLVVAILRKRSDY